jgi:succinyl-CoA synthetase beta subunit
MRIEEHHALALLKQHGIATPHGDPIDAKAALAFYVAMAVDRDSQRVALMIAPAGRRREALQKIIVDPRPGLTAEQAATAARLAGVPAAAAPQATAALQGLYRLYDDIDVLVAEIDPLAVLPDGRVVALAATLDIDPNALYRHPDLAALRDVEHEDPDEAEAARHDLAYIALSGNIGCLVNGAGLAMATMDLIRLDGGAPANFLDVGGDATAAQVTEAFKLMMRRPGLKAVLVNIFGGLMRCDVIAAGIVEAVRQVGLAVPLVVRLTGTHEDQGRKILLKSGLPVIAAHDMGEAAKKAVRAAAGR